MVAGLDRAQSPSAEPGSVMTPKRLGSGLRSQKVARCERVSTVEPDFEAATQNVAADMMTAGRKKTDPAGSMGQPKSVFTSPGQFGSGGHRWGDYAEVCTDPNDDSTFWGVVQTIAANNSSSLSAPCRVTR